LSVIRLSSRVNQLGLWAGRRASWCCFEGTVLSLEEKRLQHDKAEFSVMICMLRKEKRNLMNLLQLQKSSSNKGLANFGEVWENFSCLPWWWPIFVEIEKDLLSYEHDDRCSDAYITDVYSIYTSIYSSLDAITAVLWIRRGEVRGKHYQLLDK